MECYCEPDSLCDGEYSEVWSVTWQRARKLYRCCECHEEIKVHDHYERIFSVFEGNADTHRTCEFCANEYQRLLAKHPDLNWIKGNDDLACLIVWDIRNEDRADDEQFR